ncbi:MAG: phosphotransferase [Nitrospinota bacterium]
MKNSSNDFGRFDKEYLTSWLDPFANGPVSHLECSLLKGDASNRKYFRATYRTNSSPETSNSIIIMQLAEMETDPDFNYLQKFLKEMNIPVPDIFRFDDERGLMFLMDCGDTHLADKVETEPEEINHWYQKAIDIIVAFHTRATENLKSDCPAYGLFFDEEKLMWEMDFMLEHYVHGMLKNNLVAGEKDQLRESLASLCKTLSEQERVFTHRDYHSRNIMVHNGMLRVIDFQDARMGPCQYDLVSLLKDSYIVLEDPVREELLQYYINRMKQNGKDIDMDSFRKIFDWMSVQRNLKAVGTFAYQSTKLGNDRYLQYIEPTLEYVRRTLENRSDLEFLISPLNSAIPDLKAS